MATTYVPRVGVGASANFTTVNRTRGLSASLWALQALLALTCVMTGAMQVLMTAEMLDAQSPLPVIAARLVGLRELAVALRLILRTCCASDRSGRPVAAAGLVVLMICATMLSLIPISRDPVMMLLTGTVGIVAACVGYARLRLAPLRLC